MKKTNLFLTPLLIISLLSGCSKKPLEKYVVSFSTDYGSYVKPQLIEEGGVATKPQNPDKVGLYFYDWYNDPEFTGEPFDFETKITGDLTLYARWGHKVTFINYDQSVYQEDLVPENLKVDRPVVPIYDYHDFDNWYTESTFNNIYDFENIVENNFELYCKFTPKKYSIIYHNIVDGDINPNPSEFTYGVGIKNLADPTREKSAFRGWYLDSQFGTPVYSIPEDCHNDIHLYCNFSSTFTIDYPNWPIDIINPNPKTYTIDDAFDFDTSVLEDYAEGLTFKNYLDEDYNPITSIAKGEYGDRTIYLDYEQKEIKVSFNSNGGVLDSNTFDSIYLDYGYEGKTKQVSGIVQMGDENDGYNPNLDDSIDREDYLFAGWYLDKELTTPLVESDTEINQVETGGTIYAKWSNRLGNEYDILTNEGYAESVSGILWQDSEHTFTQKYFLQFPFYVKSINATLTNLAAGQSHSASFRMIAYIYQNKDDYAENVISVNKLLNEYSSVSQAIDLEKDGHSFNNIRVTYEFRIGTSTDKEFYKFELYVGVKDYRRQLIKTKTDKGSLKLKYWDFPNIGDPIREGYNFIGWSDGEQIIDLSNHCLLTEDINLSAIWQKIA